MLSGCKKGDLPMVNDRTFPIPSNTNSMKSKDYTNKSLQMDSNPVTMKASKTPAIGSSDPVSYTHLTLPTN